MNGSLKKKGYIYILLAVLCMCCLIAGCMLLNGTEKAGAEGVNPSAVTVLNDDGNNGVTLYGGVNNEHLSNRFEFGQVVLSDTEFSVSVTLSTTSSIAELQRDKYNHMVIFYGEASKVQQVHDACFDEDGNKRALYWPFVYDESGLEVIEPGSGRYEKDSGQFNNAVMEHFDVSCFEIPLNAVADSGNQYTFSVDYDTIDVDIGFFCYFYYCSFFNHNAYGISNFVSADIESVMSGRVYNTSGHTINELLIAHKYFGREYGADKTVSVKVNYYEMLDYFAYTEKSLSVNMPWYYYLDTEYTWEYALRALGQQLSSFDCVYDDFSYINDSVINTYKKPIRTATGYGYKNDSQMNVTFDIVYEDYSYNDVFMCLKNNSLENLLSMFIYRTDIAETSEEYKIIFDFADIERWAYSSIKWNFNIEKDDVSISGVKGGVSVEYNYDNVDDPERCTGFTVIAKKGQLNDLFGLSIVAVADIAIDYDYDCTIEYLALDKNLKTTVMHTEPFVLSGSELKIWNGTDFKENKTEYMAIINAAIAVKDFMEYSGIRIRMNPPETGTVDENARGSATIIVEYEYTTCILIRNNLNSDVRYFPYTGINSAYTLGELGIAEYDGYRVNDFTFGAHEERVLVTKNAEGKIFESEIVFNCYPDDSDPIEMTVYYSDEWPVNIMYLAPYNVNIENTPFAQKMTAQKYISVSEHGDIFALTSADIAALLELQSLNVLKSAADEKPTITYDPETQSYNVVITYSFVSVAKLGIEGQREELQVPLTCYADWLTLNDKDFSILWLNTDDKEYFKVSNEIAREDLYGYFAVAVFEEKQTSLNHILRNETGEGCPVLYSGKEVSGSGFYKFMSETELLFTVTGGTIGMLFGHPIIGAAVGTALKYGILACCEIAHDNRMLYTYMFYYDGFTSAPFISTSNADNAFDTDSSLENAAEDVAETVKDWWDKLKNSPALTFIKIILVIILSVFVIGLVVRIIRWAFSSKKK